jgi:hypothetical protein
VRFESCQALGFDGAAFAIRAEPCAAAPPAPEWQRWVGWFVLCARGLFPFRGAEEIPRGRGTPAWSLRPSSETVRGAGLPSIGLRLRTCHEMYCTLGRETFIPEEAVPTKFLCRSSIPNGPVHHNSVGQASSDAVCRISAASQYALENHRMQNNPLCCLPGHAHLKM